MIPKNASFLRVFRMTSIGSIYGFHVSCRVSHPLLESIAHPLKGPDEVVTSPWRSGDGAVDLRIRGFQHLYRSLFRLPILCCRIHCPWVFVFLVQAHTHSLCPPSFSLLVDTDLVGERVGLHGCYGRDMILVGVDVGNYLLDGP